MKEVHSWPQHALFDLDRNRTKRFHLSPLSYFFARCRRPGSRTACFFFGGYLTNKTSGMYAPGPMAGQRGLKCWQMPSELFDAYPISTQVCTCTFLGSVTRRSICTVIFLCAGRDCGSGSRADATKAVASPWYSSAIPLSPSQQGSSRVHGWGIQRYCPCYMDRGVIRLHYRDIWYNIWLNRWLCHICFYLNWQK